MLTLRPTYQQYVSSMEPTIHVTNIIRSHQNLLAKRLPYIRDNNMCRFRCCGPSWEIVQETVTNTYCNYNEYPSPLHPDPPENLFYVPKSLTTKDKKIIVFLRTTTLTQKTLLHDRCQHGNRLFALTNFFDVFNEQSGNIFVQESLIPQDEGLRICVGVFGWNMTEFSQFDRVRRHTE